MTRQEVQAEMMAIIDETVAHLVGHVSLPTLIRYKILAFYWYEQQGQPVPGGLTWRRLPDGCRHCVFKGKPWVDETTGAPLTLEELRVYDP